MKYQARFNQLRFNFPLVNCRVGERYKMTISFEVIEMSKSGTTVKLIEIQTNDEKRISQVVPSPS